MNHVQANLSSTIAGSQGPREMSGTALQAVRRRDAAEANDADDAFTTRQHDAIAALTAARRTINEKDKP